ncbi:MAG TPA: polysaccharide deacetylase family protein [Kineosporiaceae bacterium]|nr:polysaccharide deacetylase family protein [Kineosporiaceae bacterium]
MTSILRGLAAAALGLPLALGTSLPGSASPAGSTSAASARDHGGNGDCRQWMALTFDDGPSHYRTQTLRTLRRTHVPATFFDVGMRVAANPQFAQFEARQGHLVLNHTWSHPHLPALTPAQVRRQVLRTERVLRQAGAPMPFKLLRPPFGDVDAAVDAQLTRLGYHHVTWDVVATDWDVATTSAEIRDTIVKAFRPGLVILMHDGAIDSANGPADEAALPQIIRRAKQLGYCFGQVDAVGHVVPARLAPSRDPIPEVINPVPYLPLQSYSRGKLPPKPYVIVDPAAQL